ncbi:MAG TPA: alpha-glucosidase [Balneolales bacterium]|nr:alpha-glucosidase [Balneolales bacterium]
MKTRQIIILLAALFLWQACSTKGKTAESSVVRPDTTHTWWKQSIVYEVYPRSFMDSNGDGIGDLKGIEEKLDYLKALGVNVIWLCPIFRSPNFDYGYDVSDYYHIMKGFGNMADFNSLLAAVKKRGMKLILDMVINHTSNQNHWFIESEKSKTNPYHDFYFWRNPGPNGGLPNNWGKRDWTYNKHLGQYYLHLFSPEQPDLNWDNPAVRDTLFKMMRFWLNKGVNGFRLDVVSFYSKRKGLPNMPKGDRSFFANGPHEHEYLKEMNQRVFSHYKTIMTVGEAPGVNLTEAPLYVGPNRHELDMIFQFDVVNRRLTNTLPSFKDIFVRWDSALTKQGKGWNAVYLGNHDNPRIVSRLGNDSTYRVPSAKLLGTLLLTMRGTPFLYQGDELGMTNASFTSISQLRDHLVLSYYKMAKASGRNVKAFRENLLKNGRDNARTPMQWNDTKNGGFTSGNPWIMVNPNYKTINVAAEERNPNSVLNYYKRIIKFRHDHDAMVYGAFKVYDLDNPNIFAYTRGSGKDRYLVLLNMSNKAVDFAMPGSLGSSPGTLVIDNYEDIQRQTKASVQMRPWEAMVYKL